MCEFYGVLDLGMESRDFEELFDAELCLLGTDGRNHGVQLVLVEWNLLVVDLSEHANLPVEHWVGGN